MAIIDNRTLLTDGGTVLLDAAGSAVSASDTANFIEGTDSQGAKVSATVEAFLYNTGGSQDYTGYTFYFWCSCSFPIADFATGGIRIRFCGTTIGNYFEKHVRGVDTGYSGGFTMVVADIERCKTDADLGTDGGTGGTSPAVNAIQYLGIVFDVPGMVSGNFNNCNVDAMWALPPGSPGIRVEADNGGSPWTWADIADAADVGDPAKAWGTAKKQDGIYFINTPIDFGTVSGSADQDFEDTNAVIAWEDHIVDPFFYRFRVLAGSGLLQRFVAGNKVGSGSTAIGNQGWVVLAESIAQPSGAGGGGVRWEFEANNADIDQVEILGCSFLHGGTFSMDSSAVEIRSCQISDTSKLLNDGSDFSKNTILQANTSDGIAFIQTTDPSNMADNSFVFSDGHAIEITATGSYVFTGNQFSNYGSIGSTDAAIYNTTGTDTVTINIGGGGSTPTYRNSSGSTTVINNNVVVTLTGMFDNTEVRVFSAGTTTELAGIENATDGSVDNRSFSFSLGASVNTDIVVHNIDYEYIRLVDFLIPVSDSSVPIQQRFDRTYFNPI